MKIEIEIDEKEIRDAIVQRITQKYEWEVHGKADAIFKSMDWSKMVPHVQEAILKMAAEKLFKEGRR